MQGTTGRVRELGKGREGRYGGQSEAQERLWRVDQEATWFRSSAVDSVCWLRAGRAQQLKQTLVWLVCSLGREKAQESAVDWLAGGGEWKRGNERGREWDRGGGVGRWPKGLPEVVRCNAFAASTAHQLFDSLSAGS